MLGRILKYLFWGISWGCTFFVISNVLAALAFGEDALMRVVDDFVRQAIGAMFVGNVILKLYEGLGSTFMKMLKTGLMKDTRSKVGALLVKPAVKETMKAFDASEYGGAPLLGLKGLVVKTHGSARAVEIRHAIFQCVQFRQQKINEKIAAHMVEETPEKA